MPALKLKSVEFRREREASWAELERLVGIVEKRSVRALSAAELARLPVLYRATLSSLSVARAISLDRNLLDYLESLTGRAYFCVYGAKRHLREALAEFFLDRFPAAVRHIRGHIAMSALLLILGGVVGFTLTLADENRFYSFMSEDMAQGRGPTASDAQLLEPLYHESTVAETLTGFASFLFRHNATIGIFSFALGFVAGIPTILLIFTNGLSVGALAAIYHQRGLSLDLWAWLLPHGVTELSALVLCGAAGLVLGQSLLFPGELSRLANFARRGREAGLVVVGAVVMLFIAALIEGIFRQVVMDVTVRYIVALATLLLWAAYFVYTARRARREAAT
jgi:uncharacterized membrane protein SpoIIM required for sporulation